MSCEKIRKMYSERQPVLQVNLHQTLEIHEVFEKSAGAWDICLFSARQTRQIHDVLEIPTSENVELFQITRK